MRTLNFVCALSLTGETSFGCPEGVQSQGTIIAGLIVRSLGCKGMALYPPLAVISSRFLYLPGGYLSYGA